MLDGRLSRTPYIDYTSSQLSATGIAGNAQITEPRTADGRRLALVLQSGSLPYTFQQIEQTKVSATLGKSSLHQALLAAAASACWSSRSSCSSSTASSVSSRSPASRSTRLLYYAAILLFNVTLTLPGFAGLILTIGVAADANVVVFERIKEEVRAGRSVRAAIAAGYGKGFHTILDANVVTAITALVLFLIAVADVKGFALMLLIGTAISLLTAVAATRAMLGLLSGFKWFDNPRFMGAEGQQTAKWLQIDFMGKRKLWFAISGAIIVAGLISLGVAGPQSRDRLQGRHAVHVQDAPAVLDRGQSAAFMASQGQRRRRRPGPRPGRRTATSRASQVRTKSLDAADSRPASSTTCTATSATSESGAKNVSGTFGHQIAQSTRSTGSSSRCS